ncbi:hypothetical protein PHMEG_00019946 [Phytophthora megakarya]|uniref:Uncharacterized protein n=1 Tax=Phytophthora megakarya TaxID=4795 RepID=A0A225VRW3_9STRA|nr:hypothetical protein PHMEG_00019946 [Phytophthora megakarya]
MEPKSPVHTSADVSPVCKKHGLQDSPKATQKKPKRKHRKSTINVRKEEKAHLLEELAELHTKMEQLKARAFATCVGVEAKTPSELKSANRVLRQAIQMQQLECTQIHALMSEYSLFNIRVGSPIHRYLHLQKDTHARRAMLMALKSKVLEDGAKFLTDRRPRVDPLKPMREDHGYEASNGDFFATYISTMQFENTVKQVYDILLGYFSSIEISVSEKLGNITIREDDDSMGPGITTNRMVSTTIGGLRMESNTVYFSRYEPGDGDAGHQNGYGIFVADYVDDDDLNPYHPHERIRRNFSAVLELKSYRITHGVRTRSKNTSEGRVVVLTRWVHSKVYHPEYEIPQSGWHEMLGLSTSLNIAKSKRKRKYRKATHTIRKEEKEILLQEIETLKTQITELRSQTRVPFDENKAILKRKYDTGRVLREGVQQRQQMFSQLSAIMSEYSLCAIQSGSPLEDFIHLKNDELSRHDTLALIKMKKMEKAQRFMQIRRPKLDPCNMMAEERRYEAENGDFCSTRFTVTQFEDAKSVKQVFDLLLFYFCNIEISISEKIGHITIREDDGVDDKGIVQNRLVSTTHKDVKMESNTIMFSQYYDRSTNKSRGPGDRSYGLIVADFVDEDERHPYVPNQRVRRDVNAVLEIREFEPQRSKSLAGDSPSRKSVVVLSRWVQNRMHYPKFPVCTEGWYELRDNMDLWGRALHRTIAENLRG